MGNGRDSAVFEQAGFKIGIGGIMRGSVTLVPVIAILTAFVVAVVLVAESGLLRLVVAQLEAIR